MLGQVQLRDYAFIPHRNAAAVSAYYMAVFSCVPLLGLPLGGVAVFSGISGLMAARANPAVKGAVHAWVGVILGSVTSLAWLALLVVLIDRFTAFALLLS